MQEEEAKKDDGPEAEAPEAENAEAPEAAEAEAAAEPGEPAGEAAEAEGVEPTAQADLEAQIADLNDKLLRALAETENVRRRAERDRVDASKYAIADFAREMLTVSDNLARALESIRNVADNGGEGAAEGASDETPLPEVLKNLIVGIEMTEREMLNTLGRFGIEPIEALNQKFDHNRHEAMYEVEDPEKPAGTVVHVVQEGYLLHDRLLRPSKVGVSKGGPKAAPEEGGPEESPDEGAGKGPASAYEKPGADAGSNLDEEL